ncbi:hypothetical protein PULV_a3251 [Pseudoalteromonas ulvae UL12]|nr:hypothetical protein [Pseudoalteromonas ulvae UL12]
MQWHTLDNHTVLVQQAEKLKYYDSNQIIITGTQCLAIFDASGDFSQVENMAKKIKLHFKQPVCYLIASHHHDDHLLGMAVLQKLFPSAKLITHQALYASFTVYQQAFEKQLATYQQSITLNEQRLSTLELKPEQQHEWTEKLLQAKRRLKRWQTLSLNLPDIAVDTDTELDLGNLRIQIMPRSSHTLGDLMVYLPHSQTLLASDIGDPLPYLGDANIQQTIHTLNTLLDLEIKTLIPGHGSQVTKEQLKITQSFILAIDNHASAAVKNDLDEQTMLESFKFSPLKEIVRTPLDEKAYKIFVAAGLKQAYSQHKNQEMQKLNDSSIP